MMRIARASLVVTLALLGSAGPAWADSASLSVTTDGGLPDPVAYIPRVFTVSGTATGSVNLYVKHRAAGGPPCAASAYTDSGTFLEGAFYGVPISGAFAMNKTLTWRRPGTWLVCFWMASEETSITAPTSQVMTVRGPPAAIGATMTPNPAHAGEPAQITVAGTTEAPRRVYAKIRAADGTPCGPTFDADPGGGMIAGWSVEGAFAIKANLDNPVLGQYLICTWLAGDSADDLPVAGPVAQVFGVVRPRPIRVSSASAVNCKTHRKLRKIRATKLKSLCMRYGFSSPPLAGERLSLSYVTPARRVYKTVGARSRGARAIVLKGAALPSRAFKRRRGTWRAILRVDNHELSSTTFKVTR
jgi:hypothetical protein